MVLIVGSLYTPIILRIGGLPLKVLIESKPSEPKTYSSSCHQTDRNQVGLAEFVLNAALGFRGLGLGHLRLGSQDVGF